MSMRPKRACAAATAAAICASSLTSRSTASARSGASATSSARRDLSRAVITARRPAASTWRASSYPKPVEHPVINHTCGEVGEVDAVIVGPLLLAPLDEAPRSCGHATGSVAESPIAYLSASISLLASRAALLGDQMPERRLDIFGMQMAHDVFQRRVFQQQAGRRGNQILGGRMRRLRLALLPAQHIECACELRGADAAGHPEKRLAHRA